MIQTAQQHLAVDLFARDAPGLQMRVLLDQGVHRHLQFRRPSRAFDSWFDLISFPGGLTISGCRESWTFRRTYDMFGFFRADNYRVDPQYFAQKLDAPDGTAEEYSKEALLADLTDAVDQWQEGDEERLLGYLNELREHAQAKRAWTVTGYSGEPTRPEQPLTARGLRAQIRLADSLGNLEHEPGARDLLSELEELGVVSSTWEWNLKDYQLDFLWSVQAICWGIHQYDNAVRSGAHKQRSALVPWDDPHPTIAPSRPGPFSTRDVYTPRPASEKPSRPTRSRAVHARKVETAQTGELL